jgi:hypothetical protein
MYVFFNSAPLKIQQATISMFNIPQICLWFEYISIFAEGVSRDGGRYWRIGYTNLSINLDTERTVRGDERGGGRRTVKTTETKYIGPVAGAHKSEWPILTSIWLYMWTKICSFTYREPMNLSYLYFDLRLTWYLSAICNWTWCPERIEY